MASILDYRSSDFPDHLLWDRTCFTKFSHRFREGWQIARSASVLRYDVGQLQSRQVHGHGKYSYLLQLNPERRSNRRTPEIIDDIKKKFNPEAFHFGRVPQSEVILKLQNSERGGDVHSVLVNVSPISPLHSLLCPSVERLQPQVVTQDSLRVALEVYFLARDPDLRIGFNSLCALASVNHLHYHLLVEGATLAAEKLKCQHLIGPLYLFEENYPVRAFCFQLGTKLEIDKTVHDAYKLLHYFIEKGIAHNLLITRGQNYEDEKADAVRILVWPRKSNYGAKQLDRFNVAVLELAGLFPVYDDKDFVNLEASDLEKELSNWKVDKFENLLNNVIQLFQHL